MTTSEPPEKTVPYATPPPPAKICRPTPLETNTPRSPAAAPAAGTSTSAASSAPSTLRSSNGTADTRALMAGEAHDPIIHRGCHNAVLRR